MVRGALHAVWSKLASSFSLAKPGPLMHGGRAIQCPKYIWDNRVIFLFSFSTPSISQKALGH